MEPEEHLLRDGHLGQAKAEHRENVDRLGIHGGCHRKEHEGKPKEDDRHCQSILHKCGSKAVISR